MEYIISLILAIIGFVLAYYVWKKKSRKEKLHCVIGKDCNKVINSRFGKTLGIDNTFLGMIYFAVITLLLLISVFYSLALNNTYFYWTILLTSGMAALFSAYLSIVQVFVLKELCEYCLATTLISILIFIILAV